MNCASFFVSFMASENRTSVRKKGAADKEGAGHRTDKSRFSNRSRRASVRSSCTVVSSSDASIRKRRATSGSKYPPMCLRLTFFFFGEGEGEGGDASGAGEWDCKALANWLLVMKGGVRWLKV